MTVALDTRTETIESIIRHPFASGSGYEVELVCSGGGSLWGSYVFTEGSDKFEVRSCPLFAYSFGCAGLIDKADIESVVTKILNELKKMTVGVALYFPPNGWYVTDSPPLFSIVPHKR